MKAASRIGSTASLTLIAVLAMAGCMPGPISCADSSGTRVELATPARRIVSTVPSNTEILYSLGLRDRVVAVTRYCRKTCDTRGKLIIGGWTDPDIDKVAALRPDLIFAFGGLQKPHAARFRRIAPAYFFQPLTVEEILRGVLDVGTLTGTSRRAEKIVAAQRRILGEVQSELKRIPSRKPLRVARVFGAGRKVLTVGNRDVLNDVIEQAGAVNVFAAEKRGFFHMTFEDFARHDPDVLLVHGEDPGKVRAAFKKCPHFGRLRAVRQGRVVVRSCAHICHPNARIAETVRMLAQDFYPQLTTASGE